MKKSIRFAIALLSSASIILTGCSMSGEEVKEATEYLNDEGSEASEEVSEAASEASSTIVIEDLFEPIIDSTESGEAASDASTQEAGLQSSQGDPVNIVCFGDSQLANGRFDGSDIPHMLPYRVPNAKIYNMAIGGTTASVEQTTSDTSPAGLTSTSFLGMAYCFAGKSDRDATLSANYHEILDTMNSIDPADVDYYIISYGTNDFFNNVPLDVTPYDSVSDQDHALYNSMNKALDILQSISPDAIIIILTPFYGIYLSDDGTYIGDSYIVSNGIGTLADYADKVKNVAEDRELILVDCMYKSRFDLYLDTANEYLADNLHLSLKGRQVLSRILAHEINFREMNEPYAYLETDYIEIATFDPNEYYRYDEGQMKEYFPESWEKYIKGIFPLAQPSPEAAAEYGG